MASSSPSRFTRLLVPLLLILVWFGAAGIGGPYFGRVEEVSTNDQATFLPTSADATRVAARLPDFLGDRTIPGIAVFTAGEPLSAGALGTLREAVAALGELEAVEGVSPLIPSGDGLAAQAFLPIDADADIAEVVAEVRAELQEAAPAGVTVHLTGPAGFTGDLTAAFSGIDGLLLLVALGAVLVILLAVYRSVLLPAVVLLTSLFALCVALLVNWWLARWGVFTLTGQTQGILFILVIGAATDYSLLYTARYAEELRRHADRYGATRAALRGSLEPILASGGTVIAGLLCLLLSDLGSNRSLGPVAAVGIVFSMLAALTLLPALLYVLGRGAYWPQRPVYDPSRTDEAQTGAGVYARIGRWIARRPR
ncbi:MMPL family transporter, partial [Deinococcus sp. MIMF12]